MAPSEDEENVQKAVDSEEPLAKRPKVSHFWENKVRKRVARRQGVNKKYTPLSGDTNPTPSLKWCYTIG
jgi:hypothetical protein